MNDQLNNLLEVPRPAVSPDVAAELLDAEFGLGGQITELPSERDRNFLLDTGSGRVVFKVSNSAEDPQVIDMENAAMAHLALVDPELPIPRLLPGRTGELAVRFVAADGREHLARVITVIQGAHLQGVPMTVELSGQIGRACARTSVGLQGFFHPAGGRTHDWDIRHCAGLAQHADAIADPGRRALVLAALERIAPTLASLGSLPAHIQHADVTLTNVLALDGQVSGVIDFGDIHHTADVCDLAAALTSVLRPVAGSSWPEIVTVAAAFLQGYQRVRPLEVAEASVVGDLLVARLATTVLISAWRSPAFAENIDYIAQYDGASWSLLEQLMASDSVVWARLAGTSRVTTSVAPDSTLEGRRAAVLGGRLAPLSYRTPLHVVRGEGAWVYDGDGRRYLDGYNNVPVLGHAHPTVIQAITRQLALLNVNARYLHANVVELAERLVATMPAGLDTCILVNSGTEAVDVAWRLATEYTGHSGAAIVDWSYHGISHAVSDFSSNDWPFGFQPDHVATFNVAGGSAGLKASLPGLARRRHEPALVMVDPMFTSAGILDPPTDLVPSLVQVAHDAGALFLADEVQSGFGRTGPQLWKFLTQQVVPDIVTLGKPMGNGHPIGAVITRREIADRFLQRQEYFSTFAASPVSSAAALAVLDVLEAEQLPSQAVRVGEYLRSQVRALKHPSVVEVRGDGLIAGIELAGSREEAAEVVERLKDAGVLIGTTGRAGNVLKVRPPLVWTPEHVDIFVSTLNGVLG